MSDHTDQSKASEQFFPVTLYVYYAVQLRYTEGGSNF